MPWWNPFSWGDDELDPDDPNDQRNYPQWDEAAGDWREDYDPFADENRHGRSVADEALEETTWGMNDDGTWD